jgi:hypothetical protein
MVSVLQLTAMATGAMLMMDAGAAAAGQATCRIERGVLLVSAQAAGLTGEFILDTGAARSVLDATQATEADITADTAVAPVRLAGRTFPAVAMDVVALDDRTRDFSTPITGVLGSDVLRGLIVEVQPDPCRVTLYRQGPPRSFNSMISMGVVMRDGVPYVRAEVSDGTNGATGLFRLETGAAAAVRFNTQVAAIEADIGRRGVPPAPEGRLANLRALSIGGVLFENITAELDKEIVDPAMGAIGEPIWSRFAMRLDYRRRKLELAPATDATARSLRRRRPRRAPAPAASPPAPAP